MAEIKSGGGDIYHQREHNPPVDLTRTRRHASSFESTNEHAKIFIFNGLAGGSTLFGRVACPTNTCVGAGRTQKSHGEQE